MVLVFCFVYFIFFSINYVQGNLFSRNVTNYLIDQFKKHGFQQQRQLNSALLLFFTPLPFLIHSSVMSFLPLDIYPFSHLFWSLPHCQIYSLITTKPLPGSPFIKEKFLLNLVFNESSVEWHHLCSYLPEFLFSCFFKIWLKHGWVY